MIKINFLDKNIQDKENEILNIRPNTEKKILWVVQKNVKIICLDNIGHDFGSWKQGLESINQELLDLSQEQEEDGNPVIRNINGFIMAVVTDDNNPVGSLKRRYAIAKNTRGVVQLKGEPSFSASDQILIDELVFYIQQNDLKAF